MPRKGRSNEEIIHALHQVEGGEKVTEVCRRLGVSEQTFYRWKKQFAGLGLSELRELRSLRHENSKLLLTKRERILRGRTAARYGAGMSASLDQMPSRSGSPHGVVSAGPVFTAT